VKGKKGGRGLKLVEDVVCEEKCSLFHYLSKSREPLLKAVRILGLLGASETKRDFVQCQQCQDVHCSIL